MKQSEQSLGETHVEACAVVADREGGSAAVAFRGIPQVVGDGGVERLVRAHRRVLGCGRVQVCRG